MGKHEFPGAIAAHDQDGAMREQAEVLLRQMNACLMGFLTGAWPLAPSILDGASSDS